MDEYHMDRATIRKFFANTFPMMRYLRLIENRTTGTTTHCAWEMLLEIEYDVNEPKMGIVAGQNTLVRGVSILDWRWEGPGGDWDGDLSEEAVRGWKIVREHDYMTALKAGSEGEQARILQA